MWMTRVARGGHKRVVVKITDFLPVDGHSDDFCICTSDCLLWLRHFNWHACQSVRLALFSVNYIYIITGGCQRCIGAIVSMLLTTRQLGNAFKCTIVYYF